MTVTCVAENSETNLLAYRKLIVPLCWGAVMFYDNAMVTSKASYIGKTVLITIALFIPIGDLAHRIVRGLSLMGAVYESIQVMIHRTGFPTSQAGMSHPCHSIGPISYRGGGYNEGL